MRHLHLLLLPLTNLFATTLLGAALLGACVMAEDEDPEAPEGRSAAVIDGASYEITTASALSSDQLQAIAQFLETQGADIHKAKVMVHQDQPDAGPQVLAIELWGGQLPGEEIGDALRQEFECLADAQIAVASLGSVDAPAVADVGIEPGDDPETIKHKVIEDLRSQGVEGDIDVSVTPLGDGHHEVEVEVHEHAPE